ncbi:MAG: MoaD/ThiS family protein [Eubacteriales bacterium]
MKISVKLFPPLKFEDGTQKKSLEVKEDTDVCDLLALLEYQCILDPYGKDALLILIDGKMAQHSTVLMDAQTVEVLLFVAGG